MKKFTFWTACFLVAAGWIPAAFANKTNVWPFTTATQYEVSNSNYIEVADGVAKLKLQAATVGEVDIDQYLQSSVVRESLVAGPDVLLSLKKNASGGYLGIGTYVSRVLDGGESSGNRWDYLQSLGYNTVLANAAGEVTPGYTNIQLLLHMNNDAWVNEVNGVNGTAVGGPTFNTAAKMGSHAGSFSGGAYVQNSGAFNNSQFTVSMWVNCSYYPGSGAYPTTVSFRNGSTVVGSLKVGDNASYLTIFLAESIGFRAGVVGANTAVGTFGPNDQSKWRHIVMTYDSSLSASKRIAFYKDGVALPLANNLITSALGTINRIDFGGEGSGLGFVGRIDEACVFGRAFSAAEVEALYRMPRSLMLQCRTGESIDGIESGNFVGPDGTVDTYFGVGVNALQNAGPLDRLARYIQYKAYFIGQNDGLLTPVLDSIGIIGSRLTAYDNVLGDFSQSKDPSSVLILPDPPAPVGVGLNKDPNGGYSTSGTYISRTLDAGASVFWDLLRWTRSEDIKITEPYLLGLWHLDGGWSDGTGHGYNGYGLNNISYTAFAKLGSQSAVFDGSTSSGTMALGVNGVGSVEFWINAAEANGGVLGFDQGRSIRFRQRLVQAVGFSGTAPSIFVNGQDKTSYLQPGWNHVAVVFPTAITSTNLLMTVGTDGTDYFKGMMDELAVYTAAQDGGNIKTHYLKGGGASAGTIRFQVRASESFPIPGTVSFVGPGNSPSAFFTAAAGSALPSDVWRKRYFQYKIYLDGDGTASPEVSSVYLDYSGAATGTAVDDAATNLLQGTFVDAKTRLLGATLSLDDLSFVPGLVNLDPVNAVDLEGLWHLDELSWPAGASIIDSSSHQRHGDPQNGAMPISYRIVGAMAGSFSGINQYLILPSILLQDRFTVQAWFYLTSTLRSAVLSRDDGRLVFEVNGNGSDAAPGAVTLIVSDGTTRRTVTVSNASVNDGRWHHLACVRDGASAFLYLDGARVASMFLGSMDPPGLGQISVARHGETGWYMAGGVDEISIFSRALSDAEIVAGIAVGDSITKQGHYVSAILDAGGPAIWESVAWEENGPFGDALSSDDTMVGLWSMDTLQGSTLPDGSPSGNDGQAVGTVGLSAGKFGQALSLAGGGGVSVSFADASEQGAFTVEAWVKLDAVNDRVIFSRRSGSAGYELAVDANGFPSLSVGTTTCAGAGGLRPGAWTHLAGTFDGLKASLYENGSCVAAATVASVGALPGSGYIGQSPAGTRRVVGGIDQVAVYTRALNSEEIVDRARAGMGELRFQGRAGDTPTLAESTFVGAGGSSNAFFDVSEGSSMLGSVTLGRYFQFQAFLSAGHGWLAPRLQGVRVKQSRYPGDNPWVGPKVGSGAAFLGQLLTFSHVLAQNTDVSVRYQLTGDSTNWFWWNTSAANWENVTGFGYDLASPISDLNAHMGSFARTFYDKTGGELRFRAYLHSAGNDQVAIDEVRTLYSEGRITVEAPNGTETNKEALLTGVPYTIRWSSSGKVSNQLKLEYSRDGGSTWPAALIIATNVSNTGSYVWLTPDSPTDFGLVRITDMQDATVSDTSDSIFQLVQRFRVRIPNGGEYWLTGRANTIEWAAASFLGNRVHVYYAADGATFNYRISPSLTGVTNVAGSLTNRLVWNPTADDPALPSETGRIRVETLGGQGTDDSDEPFTLAGLAFINPTTGSYVNRGGTLTISWVSAGAGTNVAFDFSIDDGATWTNVLESLPNQPGQNTYAWMVDVSPSDFARMRCRALSGNTNLVGLSKRFVVADVQVTVPNASSIWLAGTTNTVVWMAGGVGNAVNLYYSTNSGAAGSWVAIDAGQNYPNISGSNTFSWVVPPYPGDRVQVKVESKLDPTNLWSASDNFRIAGVRILSPNGGEVWRMGVGNPINWTYESAGADCTIYFSYDGETFFTFPGGQVGLIDRQTFFTPDIPTVQARAKIVANNPSPFSNVFDISDNYVIVGGIKVTSPTNGALYTVGTAGNRIAWTSAGALQTGGDGFANLYYTTDGGVTSNFITRLGNNENYPGGNAYNWNMGLDVVPSEQARIIIQSGGFIGLSETFLLRGVKITAPEAGRIVDIGASLPISWVFAGLDGSAMGYFYLSTDGGVTFPAQVPGNALNAVEGAWSINSRPYAWSVPWTTMPSTNAVIKFVVTQSAIPADVGYEVRSPVFTLRGLKVQRPHTGSLWAHDSTNNIELISSVAGPYVSLFYSPDGVTYDLANPVAQNTPIVTGLNLIAWPLERFRDPSGLAQLRAVSLMATNYSEPFGVRGVKVTNPQATTIWAVGDVNTINWLAFGVTGTYAVDLLKPDSTIIPVTNGVTGNSLNWTVTLAAVGSNVVMRVRDAGGDYGLSQPFRIVAEPTVALVAPTAGVFWRVSDTNLIRWSRGGQMSNDFRVSYLSAPYTQTNEIFSGQAAYNSSDNTFSIPWIVPDRLGSTRIVVQNNQRADIVDQSAVFLIVGKFTMIYPNGGQTGIYALKTETVSWYTEGSVDFVNLSYSTDPLHGTGTWARINSSPIPNPGRGTEPSSYSWTPPNLKSDTVRLRIEQADRPGAYDDSDSDFAIRFYQILWRIIDSTTSNELTKLSVSDSSGWSEAALDSPVLHEYPYGAFDTVWVKEYFFNNVVFNWKSEPSRTIFVYMKRSEVEPDYNVLANFVYDPSNAVFRVSSWLERRGVILTTPAKCTISVYDVSGNRVAQLTSTTPAANGLFWQTLPSTLARGQAYFAKVEIEYSATVYSSGVTFNLRVPTEEEQALQMMNTLSNVLSGVTGLNTNLNELATAQAAFRASVTDKLDFLTNSLGRIPGLTNLEAKIDSYGTQSLARLDLLTNTIGVLGAGNTNNVLEQLAAINREIGGKTARILTRPTSVKLGSSVNILYRSQAGATATISVNDAGGAVVVAPTAMTPLPGGVFEKILTANWGLGDYVITVDDSLGLTDKMILKVTALELDDMASSLGSVSGQLANIEFAMDGMSASMSNVVAVVSTLDDLTNIAAQVAVMTNSIAQVAALTNMPNQMNGVVAAINQLGSLTNLGPQVDLLTGVIDRIIALTNMSVQLDTMSSTMDRLGTLTNLTPKVDALTASMTEVIGLTNLSSQMSGVVGAINSLGSLTNLGPQVDLLTGAMDQITGLTNMASQMNQVIAAVNSLGSLTNLGPQVDTLTGAMDKITGLTNMAGQVAYLTTTLNSMTNLGTKVDQFGTTLRTLTNMPAQVAALSASVNQLGSLTNLGPQVDVLMSAIGKITGLTNMSGQVTSLTTTLNTMTNLGAKVDSVLAGIGQLGSLTNLGGQVDALNGAMGQIMELTNMAGQVNGLVSGLSELNSASVTMSNSLAQIYASLAPLQSVSNSLGSVSSLSSMISEMETKIGTDADTPGSDTVFGRLSSIEENLGSVGDSAAGAQQKARAARTEAANAASAISQVKSSVAEGQIPKIMSDLADLRKALGATMDQAGGVRDSMGTEKLVQTLRDAMGKIDALAKDRGIKTLGQEDLKPGEGTDPKTVSKLMDKMAETKAMMEAMRLLMDEAVNKPVVVGWLEGSQ